MPEDVSPHWRGVSWCFGLEFSSLQDVRDTFLWFVNYAAHTHRSAIIREASSCNRWELTQTLTTGQCIERQTLEHTVLHGISSLNPSSKLRGLCGRGRKILRVRGGYDCKETVSFRHTGRMNSQRLWHHAPTSAGSRLTESQHWKGNVDTKFHPNQEAVCNWYLIGNRKLVSPMACHWMYPPQNSQALSPGVVNQHKNGLHVCFLAFVDFLFCLCVFFVCFIGFCLFLRKRKIMKLVT